MISIHSFCYLFRMPGQKKLHYQPHAHKRWHSWLEMRQYGYRFGIDDAPEIYCLLKLVPDVDKRTNTEECLQIWLRLLWSVLCKQTIDWIMWSELLGWYGKMCTFTPLNLDYLYISFIHRVVKCGKENKIKIFIGDDIHRGKKSSHRMLWTHVEAHTSWKQNDHFNVSYYRYPSGRQKGT